MSRQVTALASVKPPKQYGTYEDAMRAAQQRFFSVGGHGLGTVFMDSQMKPRPGFTNELRLANVQSWIIENCAEDNDERIPTLHHLALKPWRTVMPSPVFALDEPLVFRRDGYLWRNLWHDSGADARAHQGTDEASIAEQCAPFLDLVGRCLNDPERVTYFIDWLRVALQPRDRKPPTALYTYGAPGQFKGTVLSCIAEAMGHTNVSVVGNEGVLTDMNAGELFQCRLAVAEEVRPHSHDGSAVYTTIKAMVASDGAKDRRKNRGFSYEVTPAMLWLQANHAPPFLEEGDRRFYVVRWEIDGLTDNDDPAVTSEKANISNSIHEWLHSGGAEALRAYLTMFPPTQRLGDAPATQERRDAIVTSSSLESKALADWLAEEVQEGIIVFRPHSLNLTQFRGKGKHVAREAELVEVALSSLSGAEDPRITVTGSAPLRGQSVYVREGWRIRNRELVHVSGETRPLDSTSVSDPTRWPFDLNGPPSTL